jgi:PAS domain S-box-containing protein
MKKNNAKPMRPIKLRKRTEELLNKNPVAIKKIPPKDVRNLLEDLQIYQIELEKHSNALQRAHENLIESKEQYRSLLANIPVGVFRSTPQGKLIATNLALIRMLGYESEEEVLKIPPVNLYVDPARGKELREQLRIKGSLTNFEIQLRHRDGSNIWAAFSIHPVEDNQGNLIYLDGIICNITEHKQAKEALQKAHDELERRVEKRTKELEIKTNSLEEVNMALKVLLKKREEDKTEIGNNVLTNVKELIEPYFEKMKKTELDDRQKAFLSIIESNLNEVTTPFTRKMSMKYLDLTPKEIQIANLIRHGNSTRKIAKLINISPRTVDTHRKNIRKKIGIDKKKANLRSHLSSLY